MYKAATDGETHLAIWAESLQPAHDPEPAPEPPSKSAVKPPSEPPPKPQPESARHPAKSTQSTPSPEPGLQSEMPSTPYPQPRFRSKMEAIDRVKRNDFESHSEPSSASNLNLQLLADLFDQRANPSNGPVSTEKPPEFSSEFSMHESRIDREWLKSKCLFRLGPE